MTAEEQQQTSDQFAGQGGTFVVIDGVRVRSDATTGEPLPASAPPDPPSPLSESPEPAPVAGFLLADAGHDDNQPE